MRYIMDTSVAYDIPGREFESEARWLREHPMEWAIICRDEDYRLGRKMQRGGYAMLPKDDFEIRMSTGDDYVIDIIGRYIGDGSPAVIIPKKPRRIAEPKDSGPDIPDLHDEGNPRDDEGRTFATQVAWLKAHPGEWAIISHEPNYNRGLAIQRGQYALLPKGDFKIRQRIQRDKTVHVQALYFGDVRRGLA